MGDQSLLGRLRAHLPRGSTLPEASWERRHQLMIWVMWAHVAALPVVGVALGQPAWASVVAVLPIALCAAVAMVRGLGHTARSAASTVGLLTASSVLTWMWGGTIEAHFHFFVMVALLATYEEWFPFVLAAIYVAIHHGILGTIAPEAVFPHQHQWMWALVHAGFIAALGSVCLMNWRLAEDQREGFRAAFERSPTGALLVDGAGRIVTANAALCESTGHRPADLAGRPITDLLVEEDRAAVAWPQASERLIERRFLTADGRVGWAQWQHSPLTHGRWVTNVIDITKRKDAEAELSWQAHHDPLTRLPNRTLFVERLQGALDRRRADPAARGRVAVLFVDLDDFKVVNDSLGHHAGDRLLEAVAERLRRVLRPDDVISRFGGDEFTILLANVAGESGALHVADRLASALRAPIVLDGEQRYVTASVGLSVASDEDPDELLRDADAAMYRAKELGKARCAVFDASMRRAALERLELEGSLRHAADRGELTLLYQPQVALRDGRVIGAEALLRWDHPMHGRIGPDRFIPIAEQTGLIIGIGAWVVHEACAEAAGWPDDVHVCVNVSARQLGTTDLTDVVREALAATGLAAERLCLEITETVLLADVEGITATLGALKALGVRLAIDDFGVGHASLLHLRQLLPVDVLKIDKSFVDGIVHGAEDSAIVEGVVRLAHSLGLEAVAEGVETAAQAELLEDMACQSAQGFHFARPLEPEAVTALFARGRA